MKKWKWMALVMAATLCIGSASAHPGRTDANGGHYNHSTGEYHYHHGYPAHQHIDGVCPYDYDDRTGWNFRNEFRKFCREFLLWQTIQ